MSQEEKSAECCKPIAVTVCCEKDGLVIRIQGRDGEKLAQRCCGEAAEAKGDADKEKPEGCC